MVSNQIRIEFFKSLIVETMTQDMQRYVKWESSDSECLVGARNSSSSYTMWDVKLDSEV